MIAWGKTFSFPRRYQFGCVAEIYSMHGFLKEFPELQKNPKKAWRKVYSHFFGKMLFPIEDLTRNNQITYCVTDVLGEGTYGCVGMFKLLKDKLNHPKGTYLAVKRMKDTVMDAQQSAQVRTIYIK